MTSTSSKLSTANALDLPLPSLVGKRDSGGAARYADDDAFEVDGMVAECERAVSDARERSNEQRRHVTSEAKGADSATGTRRLQRKGSEAMSNAVM